jgi:peptidoglycan/LPS O-acetylase OafA/YrhL
LKQDRHIPALDGLRGGAALLVVLSHLTQVGFKPIVEDKLGNYGVILFFALSGFLMGHLYLRKPIDADRTIHYVAARVSRIVPLYFAAVIASFLVYSFLDKGFVYPIGVKQLVRLLTFNGSTPPFWSIGPEFQFYGVFILLWLVAAFRGPRRPLLIAATLAVLVVIYLLAPKMPGILFLSKMHIFVLGISAALLRGVLIERRIDGRVIIGSQIVSLIFLLLIIVPFGATKAYFYPHLGADPKQNFYYLDLFKVLLCTLTVLSFSFNTRLGLAIFGNRPMRLVGMYSFSIYLLHEVVLYELMRYTPIATFPLPVAILVGFAAIMLLSTASFYLLENPSRIALRDLIVRLLSSRFAPRLAPATPASS